jgi:phage terminase large subunit-like protein
MNQIINEKELINKIISDRKIRTSVTSESHYWFFNVYFSHYVTYPTAPFQREMFSLTEQEDVNNIVTLAFRGSAKSTIMTMSYPIWAILGKQKKKFVIILGQTQAKARQHLINLKREFESNELLRADLGPFEEHDEWGSYSLVLPKFGARISAFSSDQSIRGLRHGEYRPDLIIADDVEDLMSVKTREGRDKIYDWLTSDVIPAGDKNTRLVIIGNLLHEDSLLMRLKQNIQENKMEGIFKVYPLINEDNQILWPGKFNSMADIEKLKQSTGNDIAWQREYLLRIVSDTGRVVHPEWIHYYNYDEGLPNKDHIVTYVGVDLAISEKDCANRTAMVVMKIYRDDDERCTAYVMPHPFNKNVGFPEQVNQIKILATILMGDRYPEIFVEKVAYQEALIQQCNSMGIQIQGVVPHGEKRERIALTTAAIKEGLILFPEKGAEELIMQLTGFGTEKYDDLADAFSLVVNQFIIFANKPVPKIFWI